METRERYRRNGPYPHWSILYNNLFEIVIFKDSGRVTVALSGEGVLLREMIDVKRGNAPLW